MKWRPMEPSEGNIETEIPDKMIDWARSYSYVVADEEPLKLLGQKVRGS